jgi:dimethylglycine dehydrogenase
MFVVLEIEAQHAPAHPGASLLRGDKVVGTVTSGDWGHRVGKNLAYAFVDTEFGEVGSTMELDLLGAHVGAVVIDPVQYDPAHSLMRG